MWRRSSRAPAVSGALRLVSLPRIVHQHGAFAHGRAAAHSKRQHAITAGTRESPTRRKSAKRRDARRPRKRRTAHRRGRSDWPTTASCHLPHGANEGTSERARKRIMRPAHVVPLAPMRPGCSGGARRPCARFRSRKREACSAKSTLVHIHRQPRLTTHPARCSTSWGLGASVAARLLPVAKLRVTVPCRRKGSQRLLQRVPGPARWSWMLLRWRTRVV